MADSRPPRLLLDTCAIIYLFNGENIDPIAAAAIDDALIFVSPISAWEIGILNQKRSHLGPMFLPYPLTWFRNVLGAPRVTAATFNADMALMSSVLPEPLHKDPADRLLIATARSLKMPIVTRDRLILSYAAAGHVDALGC